MFLSGKNSVTSAAGRRKDALKRLGVHKIPSCAFRAWPGNSQTLFRWMSMATPLPCNISDLSIFTAKATPFPSIHRPAGKTQTQRQKFLEGRGAGRENLFPKRFPSPQAFLSSHLQALPAVPKTKKSPAERGQKKTPSRCELQGGLEQSLAAAYFPT